MAKLSICVPTYNRYAKLAGLLNSVLKPLILRYGDSIRVIIRDNSSGVPNYNSAGVQATFAEIDYKLNRVNIGYHGNILELFKAAPSDSYIWFWPDDDIYNLDGVCEILDLIIGGALCADVVIPPFSYSRHPTYRSTSSLLASIASCRQDQRPAYNIVTCAFDDILNSGTYPLLALTSSFIFKKVDKSIEWRYIDQNNNNAWLHEVVLLSVLTRMSSVQILEGPPYTYYDDRMNTDGSAKNCGMNIKYFHENNLSLKRLRSLVFNQPSLYDYVESWQETVLWLIQQKDGSISWSNSPTYSFMLGLKALTKSVQFSNMRLFILSSAYLLMPGCFLSAVRKARGSHRSQTSVGHFKENS